MRSVLLDDIPVWGGVEMCTECKVFWVAGNLSSSGLGVGMIGTGGSCMPRAICLPLLHFEEFTIGGGVVVGFIQVITPCTLHFHISPYGVCR